LQVPRDGINIEETVSRFPERIIILKTEDLGKAFTLVNDLIVTNARKTLTMIDR